MERNLESLTIHAFRGLRDLELQGLGGVNLFVGGNKSGKTSVLEAVATFSRPLDPMEWVKAVRRREMRASGQLLLEGVRWMFTRPDELPAEPKYLGETHVSGAGMFPVTDARARGFEETFVNPDDRWTNEARPDAAGDESEIAPGITLQLSARTASDNGSGVGGVNGRSYDLFATGLSRIQGWPEDPALPVATVSPFSHMLEQQQAAQLTELRLNDLKEPLVEISRHFDDGIEDIEILARDGNRPAIYVQHRRFGLAPLSTFGDGLRRALTYALDLLVVQNGVLLIDEIESSIHVSAMTPVFAWLVKACATYNVQLFATTHSLDAVDALLAACEQTDISQVVGYHLDSSPKNDARRFDGDLLHQLRYERGLDVR